MRLQADYSDQTAIFDPSKFTWPVHIIGMGGIGSALIFPLMKLGLRGELHLWDTDVVEPRNLPAQLIYRKSDVDTKKVLAAQAFAERQEADCTVVPHDEFVTASTPLEGVVISGVDSMTSRSAIWQAVQALSYLVPFYMDGRIGGEQYQLLTLNPSDFDAAQTYQQHWLFPDEEAAELPCAARTVIHPAAELAAKMVAHITLFARGEHPKANIIANMKSMQFLTS
jgi:molybdopterin/thiamine biosynthesis adenylyltransferase